MSACFLDSELSTCSIIWLAHLVTMLSNIYINENDCANKDSFSKSVYILINYQWQYIALIKLFWFYKNQVYTS